MKKSTVIISILLTSVICLGGGILNKEEPLKQIEEQNKLAIFINDEKTNNIPAKASGYYFDREKSNCTNNAYINFDSVSWSPIVMNMSEYKTKCELHFTDTYTEGILNGTEPVIKDELIPVTIENDGTVKKADLKSNWYEYANKQWVNAVITQNSYDVLKRNGAVHGATKQNGYITFDGVDDYVDLGLANYNFGNQITMAMQLKIYNTEFTEFFNNYEGAGVGFSIVNNNLIFQFYDSESNKWIQAISDISLETNKNYTIVGTYNNNFLNLYINGNLELSKQVTGNIKVSPQPILIGANPQPDGNHLWHGNVDVKQAIIYNRALSAEEIKNNMSNDIKVTNSTGLLSYVDFTDRTNYEANEVIPENIIESYFVWIPKYRYQLWDLGEYDKLTAIDNSKVHEIPLIFGDYNTSDEKQGECTTPMESGATGNCKIGDYMTHPAFLSIPSKGFWVGKFETGKKSGEDNVRNASQIQIKPNVASWRNIQVSKAFYTTYDYKRNLDSHMMKNTEWGAIAYLQHSKYGSQTSVRINNNSSYITGFSSNAEPTCGWTKTNEECNEYCNDSSCNTAYPNSVLASTTGNISGVYDMSGGSWEYDMGVTTNEQGTPISGRNSTVHSGFNGPLGCPRCDGDISGVTQITNEYNWPNTKYYDTYVYAESDQKYNRRILGDATGEMGDFESKSYFSSAGIEISRVINSWYLDQSYFAYNNNPWIVRGSSLDRGTDAGVFSFDNLKGNASGYASFRVVLTP